MTRLLRRALFVGGKGWRSWWFGNRLVSFQQVCSTHRAIDRTVRSSENGKLVAAGWALMWPDFRSQLRRSVWPNFGQRWALVVTKRGGSIEVPWLERRVFVPSDASEMFAGEPAPSPKTSSPAGDANDSSSPSSSSDSTGTTPE